jgi:hypothetical protein
MSMKEINAIKSEIGQLEAKQRDAKIRLRDASLRYMGLEIGDRILVVKRGKEIECAVSGVYTSLGEPRVEATRVKANGEIGSQSAGWIGNGNWRKKETP